MKDAMAEVQTSAVMERTSVRFSLRQLKRDLRALSFALWCTDREPSSTDDIEPDRSTRLALRRTDLALERNAMAAERTLMAWTRTALAMISFGFTLGKLGDALSSPKVNLMFGRTTDIIGVAYSLVILGTLSLILAAVQNRVEVARLVRQGLTPRPSLAFGIAIPLSLLGIFVFTDLVTRF